MRRGAPILALALVAAAGGGCRCGGSGASKKKDPLARFYRLDELPRFAVELAPGARESLKKKPRKWVEGTFRYGDLELRRVGVRLKGHRSMRPIAKKPALKIRFDKYVAGQRFLGLRRMTLNNMVEDPTMLREILGYRLYRQLEVPAPQAFYAEVSVDGVAKGLYAVIETVDSEFLERRFDDASGGLYEGEYGCDLYPGDVEGFDRDGGDKKAGRGDLRELAGIAQGPADKLFSAAGPLDMDSFLAYLAVSAFIGDFDGYRHAHNYRVYHEPAEDKWYFIPWGIDRAFKKHLSIYESFGLLARRCFADARCRAAYVRKQREVVAAFALLDLDRGAKALAAFIEPAVRRSPERPSARVINRARHGLLDFLHQRPGDIAKEVTCIDADGAEIDGDGDGYGCLDCDDGDPAIHPGAAEACDGVDNDCSGAVDDDPSCPVCPVIAAGERRYALCSLPRPQAAAAAFCAGLGGTLAVLPDAETAARVAAAAAERSKKRWWIGLDDRREEGSFRLPGGAAPGYTRWRRGEPNNAYCNQDCAVIDPDRAGRWSDTHCGQPLPFVCSLAGAGPR